MLELRKQIKDKVTQEIKESLMEEFDKRVDKEF